MNYPTLKQKKFVENKLKGMSSQKAALEAGYSPNTAKTANREIAEHRGTQLIANKLGQALNDKGVDETFLANKIYDGFGAVIPRTDGEADYKTRLDYIKYSSELQGHGVTQKVEHSGSLNLTNFSQKEIEHKEPDDLLKLSNDQLKEEA